MRRAITTALIITGLASVPTAAHACDDCGVIGTATGTGGAVTVNVGVTVGGGTAPSSGFGSGGGNPISCAVYLLVDPNDPDSAVDVGAGLQGDSTLTPGTLVYEVCFDDTNGELVWTGRVIWGAGGPVIAIPPRVLADHALAQLVLPLPDVRTWPAIGAQVVRVPTWLHADNFISDSRTASAGGVSATVTATPVSTVWNMGDGTQVRCSTAGAVFDTGAPSTTSDCTHVFERSSAREAGQAFSGSVSITWHLTWTSNVSQGGDLGNVTRTRPIAWRVEQIQSLITNTAAG